MYTVPDQTGRTVVVTGANSGTGREAAKRLAAAGAHVVLAVRNPDKGADALAEVLATRPDARAEVRLLDLADLASVRAFADGLGRDLDRLDTLVNNAGVMVPPQRYETADGHELQWGTNFLGPFALTNRLLPMLLAAPAPRVATMSSGVANRGRIDFDDLDWERRPYRAWAAYGQSKLADLHLARHLAHLAARRGWALVSTAAHPGFTRTNLQITGPTMGRERRNGWTPRSPLPSMAPPEGAGSILLAAADPGAPSGAYYGPRFMLVGEPVPARLNRRMRDDATAARLWSVAEETTSTAVPAG
ncbi:SDR family oxidoreductase [Promicromonospora sp. MEB111]|uniref:SDR family oxidoreductase n=1 Tax=unclassified Promicromonospora TaxID=2647929 RepID=UPI00254A6156|nr:SDR family oxidoreductase [Promicromonospora sp. MEB111]